MAKVNTVSFGPGQQDLQVQHMELQRRQAMIDALRKESMDPLEVQQHGPVASKINPWQGVAKLAQAYFANEGQKDVDTRKVDLDQKMRTRQAEALSQLFPDAVPSEGAELTPKQQGQNALNARILKMMQLNPDVGWKLAENALSLTNEQKDMASQGIDPQQFGKARMAGEQAKGMVNVAPNATLFNVGTNAPQFAGPDFANGRSNTYENGTPQVSRMPGANVIAQQAGEIERAKSAGQAGYEMVTVDTPAGPVMMTKEQAAQMSGAPQQAPIEFTASNGTKLNFSNMSPQQVWDGVSKSGDPALTQAFKEYMASQKAPGIPLKSNVQKEREVGQVRLEQSVEEKRQKDAQEKSTQSTKLYEQIKAAIPMARTYLADATGSGVGALADKAMGAVGLSTKASQAAAQLDTLAGWMTANVPRMEGPQSNADVDNYKIMAARVGDRTLPNAERLKALDTLETLQNKYSDINKALYGGQATQIDDLLKKYGGQ